MKTLLTIGAALMLTLGTAGTASAQLAFCLDAVGFCNDLKLNIGDVNGEIVELAGYEFGCGPLNREVSGSARFAGNVLEIGVTGSFNDTQVAAIHIPLSLQTLSGAGTFTFVSDVYINAPSDFSLIPCPAAAAASADPDASR
jgi:hypothetical protein